MPKNDHNKEKYRGGSRNPGTSKMELFVTNVHGSKPLTTATKSFILNVAAVLDNKFIYNKF